jgi:hypothetical protein
MRSSDPRRSNAHGLASCDTVTRTLLTETPPDRTLGRSLRPTVTLNDPFPCPEVALSCIQGASLVAVHVQSRAADTVTATLPPSAGTFVGWPLAVVWQRAASGPTMLVSVVDPPQEYEARAASDEQRMSASVRAQGRSGTCDNG